MFKIYLKFISTSWDLACLFSVSHQKHATLFWLLWDAEFIIIQNVVWKVFKLQWQWDETWCAGYIYKGISETEKWAGYILLVPWKYIYK